MAATNPVKVAMPINVSRMVKPSKLLSGFTGLLSDIGGQIIKFDIVVNFKLLSYHKYSKKN
ncbi:MAG: hypothetical protein LBD52_07445 [Prevotellaceae bacterium]|jgi:hypothetical protein|nr:hypothetical protein [Prevotellaceae bacterium]